MKSSKTINIILGLIFLSAGIILFGSNLKLWDIKSFFKGWWTLFIIIPSLINLIRGGNIISSLTATIIGIILLLIAMDITNWSFISKIFIPIIFIYIVILLIFICKNRKDKSKVKRANVDDKLIAIFSGKDEIVDKKSYNGTCCISLLGGIDLDISNTKINKDIIIDCISVFGEIDIKTPKNVSIKTNGIPIFGGIKNKTLGRGDKSPTIYINYISIFGGVNIK